MIDPAAASRLAALGVDDFAPCIGQRFAVAPGAATAGAGALGLALLRADPIGTRRPPPGLRAPFSLIFLGPEAPLLAQGVHRLVHETLGALDLFLVPIGRDERGVRYKCVFA